MRLQKFLAQCGVASRRESESLIAAGRVCVNGDVAEIGRTVEAGTDDVTFDGKPVLLDPPVYAILNKPKGVITSAKDTHDRKTVLDCVDGVRGRVFPVGRLDMDVTGVLILTNDGELAYRLTHPKYEVEKVYLAWVQGRLSESSAKKLATGVQLEDGPTWPARVSVDRHETNSTLVRLAIHEGRKHLVKRMFAAVGHPVRELRRLSVGPIRSADLVPGEWRYLSDSEVQRIKKVVGLDDGAKQGDGTKEG